MNRSRIEAELPPAMVQWLAAHGTDATWECVARDLACALGRRLLGPREYRGEAGTNPLLFEVCRTDASPTVRHVATVLGCDPHGRLWTIKRVASAVTKYLALDAGRYAVQRRLQERYAPQTLAALAA